MTHHSYPIAAYKAAMRTIPPMVAVVMLYDEILKQIALAAESARRKNYESQFNQVMMAARIVNGLNACLDMEAGGKVAVSLREMYQAVAKALLSSVGRNAGGQALERVAEAVKMTRNAWAEVTDMR